MSKEREALEKIANINTRCWDDYTIAKNKLIECVNIATQALAPQECVTQNIFDADYIEGDLIIKNCPGFRNTGDIDQLGECLFMGGCQYCLEVEDCIIKQAYKQLHSKQKINKIKPEDVEVSVYPEYTGGLQVGISHGIKVKDLKTGIIICCDTERSQLDNKEKVFAFLEAITQQKTVL